MRGRKALFVALLSLVACGEAAVQQPVAPAAPSAPPAPSAVPPPATPAAPPADPFALPAAPRDVMEEAGPVALRLDAWDAAIKAKGVAPAPPECAAYAKRAAAKPADLVAALATKDPAKRDAMLVAVEGDADTNKSPLLRALRGDLAPGSCADVIVDPYLGTHRNLVSRSSHVLVGLSLAAKLARTGAGRPTMGAATDKEKVKAFIAGPLKTWMVEQAAAIETLSSGASGLTGYGRGVAALAAGIAEMRLVEAIRSAPTPAGWDPELKAIYQAILDEALEPRKKRGRDAALIGLADLAQAGVVQDARTSAAHALLTSLYGGRRIGALDDLMLPRVADATPTTPAQSAVAAVTPYWVDELGLGPADGSDMLGMLVRGTPLRIRALFATSAAADKITPAARAAYARARFRMGQLSWRRVDFVEAAHAAKQGSTPEDRLLLALSLALARGPNGAAEMMRAPTASSLELRHTEALDALAAEGGPLAGVAAFDAAHLRSLSPPEGTEAAPYFHDVAARFRKAESLLADPAQKQLASKRAQEIDAILAAMNRPKP